MDFTQKLLDKKIGLAWDGRGRVFTISLSSAFGARSDMGIFTSQEYPTMIDAKHGLGTYFNVYNTERLHQSLNLPNTIGSFTQG